MDHINYAHITYSFLSLHVFAHYFSLILVTLFEEPLPKASFFFKLFNFTLVNLKLLLLTMSRTCHALVWCQRSSLHNSVRIKIVARVRSVARRAKTVPCTPSVVVGEAFRTFVRRGTPPAIPSVATAPPPQKPPASSTKTPNEIAKSATRPR